MGQQQLLLLVLATVIVGLATVAGIQAFEQGSTRANQDALTNTAVKIASDVQANLQEPEQFGGAGLDKIGNFTSDDLPTLGDLGYQAESVGQFSSKGYKTTNGGCVISTGGQSPSGGTAASLPSGSTFKVVVDCASAENHVRAGIKSLDSDGIVSAAKTLSGGGSSGGSSGGS